MTHDENPWIEYEHRKKDIQRTCETSEEYEDAIRELLDELRL